MKISNRTKDIIELLLNTSGYTTIQNISRKLNISERTMYREIPVVTDVLDKHELKLSTVKGKRMKISGSEEQIEQIRQEIRSCGEVQIIDKKERFYIILMKLLHQEEPIKVEALAIDSGVSASTVRNDLKEFQKKQPFPEIVLTSQKGKGFLLEGPLYQKDSLAIYSVLQNVHVDVIIRWLSKKTEIFNPFLQDMEEVYDLELMRESYKIIRKIIYSKKMPYDFVIDDYNYVEIVLLLAVFLQRKKEGIANYFPEENMKKTHDDLKKVSKVLCLNMKESLGIDIKENEIIYIARRLCKYIGGATSQKNLKKRGDLYAKVAECISIIEGRMGIDLQQDAQLVEGLLLHLDKALLRVNSGMSIPNPMIQEIKENYGRLFEITQKAIWKTFPDVYFTEDEIGYLVLYFAVMMDKITKRTFRVLVVCSSGMGSSKMLASRLERELPEIYIKKITSLIGLEKENLKEYELIISTVPLNLESRQYLKVSPLLNENELELVKEKIQNHKYKVLKKIDKSEKIRKMEGNSCEVLDKVEQIVNWSEEIIHHFQIYEVNRQEENNYMHQLCETLELSGISVAENDLRKYIIQKGDISRFVIPTTEICYFECYEDFITKPVLFMDRISPKWETESVVESIHYIIFFFYPKEMNEVQEKFLKYFLDLFIVDRDLLETLEKANVEEIRQKLGDRFRKYLRKII